AEFEATYEILMFAFAVCASFMPCQDDWLNERSSTPPVSSTMHALRAWPELAPPDAAPLDDVEPLPPVAPDFDPHAVKATVATAASARTRTVPFTVPPQSRRRPCRTCVPDVPAITLGDGPVKACRAGHSIALGRSPPSNAGSRYRIVIAWTSCRI